MVREFDRKMWGNKPPWERPVWARFLRVQRGAETQVDFLKRLKKFGWDLSDG